MLLAIDAGNTNVVFALVDSGAIKARWRIATDPRRTGDEYAVWLYQLLEIEGFTKADVSGVIIGTVVPRALHNLEVLASKYFGVTALIAGDGKVAWPIALDVDEPQNVGADRALNAIAAHAKHKGDLVVNESRKPLAFDGAVAASGRMGGNDYWVQLSNGERWQLTPEVARSRAPPVGEQLKIRKGVFGNYWISSQSWNESKARYLGRR